jgi:hypothetical protein
MTLLAPCKQNPQNERKMDGIEWKRGLDVELWKKNYERGKSMDGWTDRWIGCGNKDWNYSKS